MNCRRSRILGFPRQPELPETCLNCIELLANCHLNCLPLAVCGRPLWHRVLEKHQSKTAAQWCNAVQAVAGVRYFTYFPTRLKPKHKRVSCKNTIMSKAEKKRPAFLKPRVNDFDRTGFKRVKKAKVFGTTTSDGQSLIRPCPLHPPGLIG